MTVSTIELTTDKGPCSVDIVTPDGARPFPVLIYCTDAGGRRPVSIEMAERMAAWGFLVAIPDLFYITGSPWNLLLSGPKSLARLGEIWGNEELRTRFLRDYYGVASSRPSLEPAFTALFAYLEQRADVKKGKVGLTGYCMGGNVALRIAAMFPAKVGAVASFHGGGLATNAPDSPHLSVAKIRGEVYVAGAVEDPSFSDDDKQTLIQALEAANVKHEVETYAGAIHGFAVSDHAQSFNPAAAERHYVALEKLLKRTVA